MSAIASFVLDCATRGRWARGLLALQGSSLHCNDAAMRHARTRLAAAAAAHHWLSALTLLHGCDVEAECTTVCDVLDIVSRQATQPREVYLRTVLALLHAAAHGTSMSSSGAAGVCITATNSDQRQYELRSSRSADEVQHALYLAATRWASWREAVVLYRELRSPSAACQARLDELTALHRAVAQATQCFDGRRDAERKGEEEEQRRHKSRNNTHTRQYTERYTASSSTHVTPSLASPPHTEDTWQRQYRARREAQREQSVLRAALQPRPTASAMSCLLHAAVRWPRLITNNDNDVDDDDNEAAAAAAACIVQAEEGTEAQTSSHTPHVPASLLCVAWRTALALLSQQHLTEELRWGYARCVGLRAAAQLWSQALARLQHSAAHSASGGSSRQEMVLLLQLWLASRASWRACLPLLEQLRTTCAAHDEKTTTAAVTLAADDENGYAWRMAEDLLARTAMPRSVFYRCFPHTRRPSYRLPQCTRRAVARALAQGRRLDELQLSALMRRWARAGRWEAVLQVYARLPTREFQRYAMQGLLTTPAACYSRTSTTLSQSEAALQCLLRCAPHMPPSTHCMCLLIHCAADWRGALRVFRACVQRGGRCNPQVMSALMDMALPPEELRRLLHAYPTAVNHGVRRRADTLLHEGEKG